MSELNNSIQEALCFKHLTPLQKQVLISFVYPFSFLITACLPDYHIVVHITKHSLQREPHAARFNIDPSTSRGHIYSTLLPLLTAGVSGTVRKAGQKASLVSIRLSTLSWTEGNTSSRFYTGKISPFSLKHLKVFNFSMTLLCLLVI